MQFIQTWMMNKEMTIWFGLLGFSLIQQKSHAVGSFRASLTCNHGSRESANLATNRHEVRQKSLLKMLGIEVLYCY